MTTPTRDLSTFETALLAELKDVVADRAYTKSKRYRLVASAATVGLAAAIGALPGFDVTTPTPAYAVSTDTGGDVVVRIHDPNDLHDLSEALAAEASQPKWNGSTWRPTTTSFSAPVVRSLKSR